ncbi:MAG: hypothetical protein HYU02_07785 [Thaumarchaeota archaeon]|nr:hypothetical protein [Nitrososphaerota archaeon]
MAESAVVYGLSTEGYQIASSLVTNKVPTIIIDENLQQAIEFTQGTAKSYKSARELVEEEPLLGIKSMEESIANANAIFFAPKIRKFDDSAKSEISSRLISISKNISKGSMLFYHLPLGVGGNSENFEVIERASGLKPDEDFTYVFAPLSPRTSSAVSAGSNSLKEPKKVIAMMKNAGIKSPHILPIVLSELHFSKETIMKYSPASSELEVARAVADVEERKELAKTLKNNDVYLDDLADGLFDLRVISNSLETGEPLLYLVSGAHRAIEGYVRYLTDELKDLMKRKTLKASKTSISISWILDKFEIRGEKLRIYDLLIERLSDYVGDVISPPSYEKGSGVIQLPILSDEKTNLVVACSKEDFVSLEKASKNYRNQSVLMLRANLVCESN